MIKRPGTGFGRRYMYNRSREQETRTARIGRERIMVASAMGDQSEPGETRRGEAVWPGRVKANQGDAEHSAAIDRAR
jgi:hypothetical protein